MKKYLLDTSVILDDVSNLFYIAQDGQNALFISEVVLEELDVKKEQNGEIGYFAREFFRALNTGKKEVAKQENATEKNADLVMKSTLEKDGKSIILNIIFRADYKTKNTEKSANDSRLIEVAKDYNFILLTNDIALKIRALSQGVESHSLRKDRVENPSDIDFWTSFKLHKNDFESLKNDPKFAALSNFSLIEITELDNTQSSLYETGRKFYGTKLNGGVELLNFDEIIKNAQPYVAPSNLEQKALFALLTLPQNCITIATGATGSGKTLVALQAGICLVKSGAVDGIIYMRNTITANDKEAELGFRKGDEGQKLSYFMYPLFGAINFTIESLKRESLAKKIEYRGDSKGIFKQEATEYFLAKHNIEMVDIAHARGITLENKFIIFDEVQNASNATIKLIGTRVGTGSRIVFLGDWAQIDHPYLSKFRNGAVSLLQKAACNDSIAGIVLHQTIRSEAAKWFDANF